MASLATMVELLRWPLATVVASFFVGKAITAVAKNGLKVEITTKRPILISSGLKPLQAAVEKVRI